MAVGRPDTKFFTIIAGLGGRPITRASLKKTFESAIAGTLDPLSFLDLNVEAVERHMERERKDRRTGPAAEAILRDLSQMNSASR